MVKATKTYCFYYGNLSFYLLDSQKFGLYLIAAGGLVYSLNEAVICG
jgi:hypothetical protein